MFNLSLLNNEDISVTFEERESEVCAIVAGLPMVCLIQFFTPCDGLHSSFYLHIGPPLCPLGTLAYFEAHLCPLLV